MNKDTRDTTLFAVGILGAVATCTISVGWGPNSAGSIEARVEQAANAALVKANLGFWRATAHGQGIDLEGIAPTEEARRQAMEVVKAVSGVTRVGVEDVSVIPLASPFVWVASKQDGRVSIEGVAPSRVAANTVHQAAIRLFASDMSDGMTLAAGAPPGVEWDVAAVRGLEALNRMQRGTVRLTDARLSVSGVATSDAEAAQITALLRDPGAGITATSSIVGPAEWLARVENGRIVMQGKVPSADFQQALLRAAGGDRRADDNSHVASTGAWQTRALAALPHLARFDMGEIQVQGRALHVSGKAPGSVLHFLQADMATIEDNFSVEYAVTEVQPDLSEIAGLDLSATGPAEEKACEIALNRVAGAGRIDFQRGGTVISRSSGEALDKLVAVARACSKLEIEIQGHTDSSGKRTNNMSLSRERAAAVKDYLVEQGLSADRLTAVGFGPDRPVASNRTDTGRARNRRIEFRVVRGESR